MSIEQINRSILVPNDLDMAFLEGQLARLSRHQIDFADLYFQNSVHESWVLEDGIVKD